MNNYLLMPKNQSLNQWGEMISRIYDGTQNYSKSPYEIHTHVTEVSGAFGKFLFKKKDYEGAKEFLPKMFVWALSLFRKVKGNTENIEEAILIKFPTVCSYCTEAPCRCWDKEKPDINSELVREIYDKRCSAMERRVNSFQSMFRKIFGESWGLDNKEKDDRDKALLDLRNMYTRLMEEVSEVAESIRFHHIYPSNFSNEMADYFAWWFALVTNFNRIYGDGRDILLPEDLLWNAYPSYCLTCGLSPCDCRPGPVRELLSKPSLNNLALFDVLTQAENQAAFEISIKEMAMKLYPVPPPIACIRIDVDDFKAVNNEISHEAGNRALKLIVTVIRQKIRARDRIFRVGGDEFAVICSDLSSLEAEGMMKRAADYLKEKKVIGKNLKGEEKEKLITLSIGIATCIDITKLKAAFDEADLLAMKSKEEGKDRIISAK